MDKLKLETSNALKDIDLASIQKEMSKAMKDVEWVKINEEVKHSLDKARMAMENINMNDVHMQIDLAKAEMEKSKIALEKIDLDNIMKEAGKNMEHAKQALQLEKEMFTEMEKDGLINSKEGFKIEYKNKSLYINGKKQSDTVTGKYRKYIPGNDYKINIEKE